MVHITNIRMYYFKKVFIARMDMFMCEHANIIRQNCPAPCSGKINRNSPVNFHLVRSYPSFTLKFVFTFAILLA